MKRLLKVLVVLLLLFLILPVTNLIAGLPESALSKVETDDPDLKAALGVLSGKCAQCHTEGASLPFYAKIPPAKGLVSADIEKGTQWMDFGNEFTPREGKAVGEVALAKVEHAVTHGMMPPHRYVMLHWNAMLGDEDREAVLSYVRKVRRGHYAVEGAESQESVLQPLPQTVETDAAKVAVGGKLFHDERLSKDDTISCASCHGLDKGGTDQERFSTGVDGKVGGINSPTVFNSGFQFHQFWDGRAADLVEQADGPVNNPIEMASNWPEAIAKLEKDAALTAEFKAVYPKGWSKETITEAIAEFEKSLVTPNAPFDRYLRGEKDAIGDAAKGGVALFTEKGCAMCHVGKLLGGQSYELMGREADYFADRGEGTNAADDGRYNVTKNEEDRFRLKVPTLRNIELTFPYFHDGTQTNLAEVVRLMGRYQLGEELTDDEVKNVLAFLMALTGEYEGKSLK